MFRVAEIKNANRRGPGAKKHRDIPHEELQVRRPDERTAPYYGTVPEQVEKDPRLSSLTTQEQGLFLLLCTKMWRRGGMWENYPAGNAKTMGLPRPEWESLETRLTETRLLVITDDGLALYQPELREQYFHFLEMGSSI